MKFLVVILFTLCSSTLGGDVSSLISPTLFNEMLKYRNDEDCQSRGFYTYEAFINAARSFNAFGTTGDDSTRKRELAAFFGQTSHETTGGWESAPDGPFAWGYCFVREGGQSGPGYYGRGPIQLTQVFKTLTKYPYISENNYEQAGRVIGADLATNPDLVATDPTISFKTAIWFWMTPQRNKPSSHDVITGRWRPSPADQSASRLPGYGVITNIINGGIECGKASADGRDIDRIGFYKRYCDIFGLEYGTNLGCENQKPFA